ncbi:MAG TPA: PAS and ANTAR domain-containing protein [Modestobacter sp.]|nr:PAS and ANTAR domain-containing protein [Modestobacter sp.]
MSSTSELPRQSDTLPRPHAHGRSPRVHGSTAPGSAAARLAGRFRCDLATEQWWWSAELYALHGIPAGSLEPTPGLLLSHVHTADRPDLREALSAAGTAGTPFAREYRVLRMDGEERTALLVCEPEVDPAGAVSALSGLVVDVTDSRVTPPADEQLRHLETEVEQLRNAMASRAAIEQAKGILMLLMGCGDQVAFDLLAHMSSHTHRKVRDVSVSIVESATGHGALPDDVREILRDACPPGRTTV